MSEKIVELNEEVIKGQIKELVRERIEEMFNKLLDADAQKLPGTSVTSIVRVTAAATIDSTSLLLLEGLLSKSQNSKESFLKPPSLSDTVVVKAAWKRFLLRYTCQVVEDITETLWALKHPLPLSAN